MVLFKRRNKCAHCGSRDTISGQYIRGWNDWCEQACGDFGHWCNSCMNITFDRSVEEYKAILPKWCRYIERKVRPITKPQA